MVEPQSMQAGGILVFSENQEATSELLNLGREIAVKGRLPLTAVAMGAQTEALIAEALACGADRVLAVRTSLGAEVDDEEAMALGLCAAARQVGPAIVLVGATRAGAEIAARAAQTLRVPNASNCVEVELDGDGNLRVQRRMYGGRFVATQLLRTSPRMATVPPKRFPPAPKVVHPHGTVNQVAIEPPAARMKRIGASERSRSGDDITKAEVLVGAGRGIKKMEDLSLLQGLAAELGGLVAGSRPLTGDVDWMPIDRRIGLSGQTVRPNLYIACGISGQIEHLVGMKGARTVVAVNSDPKAPIHAEADYSVIGDLYEIVPALKRACQNAKGKPS